MVGVIWTFALYNKGTEFFPTVEPEYGLVYVHARGNLSLDEQDAAVRAVENRMLTWPGIESVYTRVGQTRGGGLGGQIDEDVIGVIQYEFVDWRERKAASEILTDLRGALAGMPGVEPEVAVPDAGPPQGKPIQVELSADDPEGLEEAGDYRRGLSAHDSRR